jgi:hypothetical protein
MDMVHRQRHRNNAPAPVQRRTQFDLIVIVAGQGRTGMIGDRTGRLTGGIGPDFACIGRVIAAK